MDPGWGRRGRFTSATAALAVLLSGCSVVSTTSTPAEGVLSSATPSVEPTVPIARASASADPSPTSGQPTSTARFSVAKSFGKQQWTSEVIDVVHWNGQFVAVSASRDVMSDATETVIWSSSDGQDWTRTPVVLADAPALPGQLAALGDGTLVLLGAVLDMTGGQGVWRPVAWESANLTEWKPTDLGLADESSDRPVHLAYGAKGYVATSGGALWFAPDGVAWQRSAERAVSGLVAGDDGFIGVGPDEPGLARVFASGDGRTWYEGGTLPSWALAVAGVGGGEWIAVGGESNFGVWTSADGLSWTQSTSIRELSGYSSGVGIATDVTHTPLVTVGDTVYMTLAWNHCCVQLSGGRGVYRSKDGAEWSLMDFDDAVVQAGATNGEVVVLGGQRGRGAEGVLWVSD